MDVGTDAEGLEVVGAFQWIRCWAGGLEHLTFVFSVRPWLKPLVVASFLV